MLKLMTLSFAALLCANACGANIQSAQSKTSSSKFVIKRGINISHWLSQVKERPNKTISTQDWFTEKDVIFLKGLGYDHLRLPIEEAIMWDSTGKKNEISFQILHKAITWCIKNDVKAIVDFHILRVHHFNELKAISLWKDPVAQQNFCNLWQELSAELHKYPNNMVAYELFNEAVADKNEDLKNLQKRLVDVIRKTEPTRTIIIGPNKWQDPARMPFVFLPENDTNIILSFHWYKPLLVTHREAYWTPVGKYKGPLKYPGRLIEDKEMQGLSKEAIDKINEEGGPVYTLDTLEKFISISVNFAREKKLPLYCGEFGCLPACSKDIRFRWYKDMRTIFEKYDIAWANWDYKGDFCIVNGTTGEKHEDVINALLK
jgi:endoglucanase